MNNYPYNRYKRYKMNSYNSSLYNLCTGGADLASAGGAAGGGAGEDQPTPGNGFQSLAESEEGLLKLIWSFLNEDERLALGSTGVLCRRLFIFSFLTGRVRDLSGKNIDYTRFRVLFEFFQRISSPAYLQQNNITISMHVLNLSNNLIGHAVGNGIPIQQFGVVDPPGTAVEENPSISHMIAQLITRIQSLREINLSHNRLRSEDIIALAPEDILIPHENLRILNLSHNFIGINIQFQDNPNVLFGWGQNSAVAISTIVSRFPRLEVLDLSHNYLHYVEIDAIIKSLAQHPNLSSMRVILNNNSFDEEAQLQLIGELEKLQNANPGFEFEI